MLNDWRFFNHGGNPTGKRSGDTFTISAGANDKGTFYSMWAGGVVPGQRYRYDGRQSGSKPVTKMLFFLNDEFVVGQTAVNGQVNIVPGGVNNMRLDLRNWGGGGTAVWTNPRVTLVSDVPEPEPPVTEPDEPELPPVEPDPEPTPDPIPEPEPPAQEAGAYYVATDGDDSAAGTLAAPWKTLHVSVGKLAAGETLYVRGGTYALPTGSRRILIDTPNVTVEACTGETVTIDGRCEWFPEWHTTPQPKPLGTGYIVSFTGGYWIKSNPVGTSAFQALIEVTASGVTIRNLTLINSAGEGIRVTAEDVLIDNVQINYTNGSALAFMGTKNGEARDCVAYKSGRKGTGYSIGMRYSDGITLLRCQTSNYLGEGISFVDSDNSLIKDCIVFNGKKVGLYCDGGKNNVFDGCLVYTTGQLERGGSPPVGVKITAEVYPSGPLVVENTVIKNCLVVGHSPNLLIAGGQDGVDGKLVENELYGMRGFKIFNNTFVDAVATGGQDYNIGIYNKTPENNKRNTACWFANNLVVQRNSLPGLKLNGSTDYSKWRVGGNVWTDSADGRFRGETDRVNADAKLAHAALMVLERTGDFDLYDYLITEGSDAIGAGTNDYATDSGVSVDTDYFGGLRVGPIDAGFHQLNAQQPEPEPPTEPDEPDEPEPTPDPEPEPEPTPDPVPEPEPTPVQLSVSGYQLGKTVALMVQAPSGTAVPPFGRPLSVRAEWVNGELCLTIDEWEQAT